MAVGVDLHTELFSPALCSCTECGESNCLHQSEEFISSVRCRFGVTSGGGGGGRKCRMGEFLCGIKTLSLLCQITAVKRCVNRADRIS